MRKLWKSCMIRKSYRVLGRVCEKALDALHDQKKLESVRKLEVLHNQEKLDIVRESLRESFGSHA